MAERYDVVILGGGPGGRTVARSLKKQQPGLTVAVVKEHEVNPNRCVIPYIYDDTVPVPQGMISNSLVTEVGAELIIAQAEAIDAAAHTVALNGGRVLEYGKLVLALGSQPVVPPLPGADLTGVHVVREREDVEALLATRTRAKHAVVIGLGLIGAEVAASLRRAGLEVTGLDMLPHSLGALLDADYAERIDTELTRHGVQLLRSTQANAILGDDERRARAVSVGEAELPAELVVLAVGVKPRSELAQAAGAECNWCGVAVDAQQRTSLPDVYALGDCAATDCFITKRPKAALLGTTAVIQGKVAAKDILGKPAKFPGTLASWACQVFAQPVGGIGVRADEAREAGIDVVVGESKTLSQYPQIPHVREVNARLVFEAGGLRLLGAQLDGTFAMAGYLDLLALAIMQGHGARELAVLQYATHPELAPRPSDNLVVMAAADALGKGV